MKRRPSQAQTDFAMLLAPTDEEREAERQESVRRYIEGAGKLGRCPDCGHTRTQPELPCPCRRNVPACERKSDGRIAYRKLYNSAGYMLGVQEI